MTDLTNADRALAQSADQELAQLLASAHLHWIGGREVTKDNAAEMICVRLTMADRDRIIDALASRVAAVPTEAAPGGDTRLLRLLDPREPPGDDRLLARIHAELENAGRLNPDRMVSVFHRNLVLTAVARAIRALPITGAGNTRVGLPPFAAVVSFFETTESGETTAMKLGDDD